MREPEAREEVYRERIEDLISAFFLPVCEKIKIVFEPSDTESDGHGGHSRKGSAKRPLVKMGKDNNRARITKRRSATTDIARTQTVEELREFVKNRRMEEMITGKNMADHSTMDTNETSQSATQLNETITSSAFVSNEKNWSEEMDFNAIFPKKLNSTNADNETCNKKGSNKTDVDKNINIFYPEDTNLNGAG